MTHPFGIWIFLGTPVVLAAFLLWRFPRYRRFRYRSLVIYVVVMSLLIWGALKIVGEIASSQFSLREVVIVLWFTIAWRLAWTVWSRTVGQLGQRWVRWARIQRRHRMPVPPPIALIRPGRMLLTIFVFVPAFLSTVLTHRCKLTDAQNPLSTLNIAFESVRIPTSDGFMLDAWFIPDRQSERTIIVCHGAGANKGNFIWFLSPLAFHGYNVLFFDFRAHGGSDGRTTTYGIRERLDVTAAVDWLKVERTNQSRIIVGLGSSQGSMALALAAADQRIDAIILDSAFVSPWELACHHAGRLPVVGSLSANLILAGMSLQTGTSFFSPSAEKAVAAMGNRPLLVIHGDDDFVMPASHSQRLYDAARGPRQIWFGPGPHSNIITTAPSEYAKRLFGFLDKHLSPTTATGAGGRHGG